jgi:hypothetical protein
MPQLLYPQLEIPMQLEPLSPETAPANHSPCRLLASSPAPLLPAVADYNRESSIAVISLAKRPCALGESIIQEPKKKKRRINAVKIPPGMTPPPKYIPRQWSVPIGSQGSVALSSASQPTPPQSRKNTPVHNSSANAVAQRFEPGTPLSTPMGNTTPPESRPPTRSPSLAPTTPIAENNRRQRAADGIPIVSRSRSASRLPTPISPLTRIVPLPESSQNSLAISHPPVDEAPPEPFMTSRETTLHPSESQSFVVLPQASVLVTPPPSVGPRQSQLMMNSGQTKRIDAIEFQVQPYVRSSSSTSVTPSVSQAGLSASWLHDSSTSVPIFSAQQRQVPNSSPDSSYTPSPLSAPQSVSVSMPVPSAASTSISTVPKISKHALYLNLVHRKAKEIVDYTATNECEHDELRMAISDLCTRLSRIDAPGGLPERLLPVLQKMLLQAGAVVVQAKNALEEALDDIPLAILIEDMAERLTAMSKACV